MSKEKKVIEITSDGKPVAIPDVDLLAIQTNAFERFVTLSPDKKEIEKTELHKILLLLFSEEGKEKNGVLIEYLGYEVELPQHTAEYCTANALTYDTRVYVNIRIRSSNNPKPLELKLLLLRLPLMTDRGNFIINGNTRVIVSHLALTDGVLFKGYKSESGAYHSVEIRPEFGRLTTLVYDSDLVYIKFSIADTKSTSGIRLDLLLFAYGFFSDYKSLCKHYFKEKIVKVKDLSFRNLEDKVVYLGKNGKLTSQLLLISDEEKFKTALSLFKANKQDEVSVFELGKNRFIFNSIAPSDIVSREATCYELLKIRDVKENVDLKNACEIFEKHFKNKNYYNFGEVGVYQINSKLGLRNKEVCLTLEIVDKLLEELYNIEIGVSSIDLLDSIENKRLLTVLDYLKKLMRGSALGARAKLAEHRSEIPVVMKTTKELKEIQEGMRKLMANALNVHFLQTGINAFFAKNPNSQIENQTNTLAGLENRRKQAVGSGIDNKKNRDIRNINASYYNRICPVNTAEGQRIGLVIYPTYTCHVNEFGFLTSEYYRVHKRVIDRSKILRLSVAEEKNEIIVDATVEIEKENRIKPDFVACKTSDRFMLVEANLITLISTSNLSSLSVSAAIIPFVGHNESIRTTVACNMSKQALNLLHAEVPFVSTGIERNIAKYSIESVRALEDGKVTYVDSKKIVITNSKKSNKTYELLPLMHGNTRTCNIQKPIVDIGQKIQKDDLLTAGLTLKEGYLTLGTNLLVAFITNNLDTFEDGIEAASTTSEYKKLTHLETNTYQAECRATVSGIEEFTNNIPGVSPEKFKNINEDGTPKIGTKLRKGDPIIARTRPSKTGGFIEKSEFVKAIFGDKLLTMEDASIYYSDSSIGTVLSVVKGTENIDQAVLQTIRVEVIQERDVEVGDKITGMHGNKGVITRIVPKESMPFTKDGRPIDVILDPASIPSRMNIGQVLSALLGLVAMKRSEETGDLYTYVAPAFKGFSSQNIQSILQENGFNGDGLQPIFDGVTGEQRLGQAIVGNLYIMKLEHNVDSKIHSRPTGPYSAVTAQPVGGKENNGGQRIGEMEFSAFVAHGAAYTIIDSSRPRSDDIEGRVKLYKSAVSGYTLSSKKLCGSEPESTASFRSILRSVRINTEFKVSQETEV